MLFLLWQTDRMTSVCINMMLTCIDTLQLSLDPNAGKQNKQKQHHRVSMVCARLRALGFLREELQPAPVSGFLSLPGSEEKRPHPVAFIDSVNTGTGI